MAKKWNSINTETKLELSCSQKFRQLIATVCFVLLFIPVVYADTSSRVNNVMHHNTDEFIRYEVVKPALYHRRNKRAISDTRLENGFHVNEVTISFTYGAKDVILDLEINQHLIARGHFMRYQSPNGNDVVRHFSATDIDLCHYKGTIRNNAASYVAVSACFGINGVIFDGEELLYIDAKPIGNISDEHYLSRNIMLETLQHLSVTTRFNSEFKLSIPVYRLPLFTSAIVLLNIFALTFAWFENCDKKFDLKIGQTMQINSPNYPNSLYPAGSSCRYKFSAPDGYQILLQCSINLAANSSASCGKEYLYFATDGMSGAELFCGSQTVARTSVYSEILLAYTSATTAAKGATGSFTCTATVKFASCDCGWSVNTRIVGGVNALVNEYTSIVALVNMVARSIFCSVSPTMVLTSAYCLNTFNISDVGVLVGDSDTTKGNETQYTKLYVPEKIFEHPNYSSSSQTFDIGLIRTTTEILFSRGVGPVCLPFASAGHQFTNRIVEAAGWGSTEFAGPTSATLRKISLTVVDNILCANSLLEVSPTQMCTYTPLKQTCQADSGGPLYVRGNRLFLVGIVGNGNECGTLQASVNTRITSHLGWIQLYYPLFCIKVLSIP